MMSPRILVIFKTHLDIGFTDFASKVMSRYTREFIPGALKLARETRQSPERFVWTTGSWLAYRFLEDATSAQRKAMEEAIEAGDFYWHALPFTMHSELMTPALFDAGLVFSQKLDARFGRKTIAAKMTDVPGHTRGIVPQLAAAGVKLLHIGVNPASSVPSVPPIFRWKAGGREMVVVYEKEYGATTLLPGGRILSVNLTNDNLGPPRAEEIHKTYDRLRQQFPGAAITPGLLDLAAKHLWALRRTLPVVTKEIGDTWIHGIGTDPLKVARFRELSRLRDEWLHTGKLQKGADTDLALAEHLLLVAEHTWGLDIKTHLNDWSAYTARQLQRSLAKPNFKQVASSWAEQRRYLTSAVAALPSALRKEAQVRLKKLRPCQLRIAKGTPKRLGEPIRLGNFEMKLDAHGAIQKLRRMNASGALSDARHQLAVLSYQTFSESDCRRFYRQYNTLDLDWAQKDFTKPGLPASALSGRYRPRLLSITELKNRPALIVTMEFAPALRRQGAPSGISLEITALADGLDLRLQWIAKAPTRLPEAIWFGFNPPPQCGTKWRLNKLGMDLDPLDVASKGNRSLHGVTGPVKTEFFSITSPDAVLVCPGTPHLLNFDDKAPDLRHGIAYNLFNNIWGTNFPMWNSDPAAFRYSLRWSSLKD